MTREEVIERLCALATHVGNQEFDNNYAHDCFCRQRDSVMRFQFEEPIIEFIENAVRRLAQVERERDEKDALLEAAYRNLAQMKRERDEALATSL